MNRMIIALACAVALAVTAPASGFAQSAKALDKDGSVPRRWNLPKPQAAKHPDSAPQSAGGNGDGYNSLSFGAFDDGDIVVTGGTATGHAGEWDSRYWTGSLSDKCIWSANTTPVNGVQREDPRKYRAYDCAWGLWVPSASVARREAARSYCKSQVGEPYDISSTKSDTSRWYCSKLVWCSYKNAAGLDLDGDGGLWVWPIDLVNDSQTSLFASAR